MSVNILLPAKRVATVLALALAIGFGGNLAFQPLSHLSGAAVAESSGGDQGQQGQGSKGQNGQGAKGNDGQGQGGPDADSEGKGPKAGNEGSTRSGKPNWAEEGIPEVELGRLSVARSPSHVLDRAYDEALASLNTDMVTFYNMSLDDIISNLSLNFDQQSYVDSPLQNLAFLRDALDGSISLPGVTNSNEVLEAVFLGVASDKTVPITTDTVIAVSKILGTPITGDAAAALAVDAEAVRVAVLAGHG